MPYPKIAKSLTATVICASVAIPHAVAQPVGVPLKRPSEQPLEVPAYEEAETVPPLKMPDIPQPAAPSALPALRKIRIEAFEVTGNTVFSNEQLAHLVDPYEKRDISAGELQQLRYELTLFYVNQGYINSGAIIPDQTVTDGIVRIEIIEGQLNRIDIDGNQRLNDGYIRKRAMLGGGPPLNIKQLGDALQILQQNPRIEQVNASLSPGASKGESVLNIDIREAQAYELWIEGNNHQPPSVGGNQASIRGIHRNLSSYGDTLAVQYDVADGLDEWDISYALPVTARDTELRLGYTWIDSEVVEDPFDVLDIKNKETTISLGVAHPFYRTVNESLFMGLTVDKRQNRSWLLGDRFDFTRAAENGETKLAVIRFSQEWTKRQQRQVFAARSLLSRGVDWLDATVNGLPQDGKFTAWLGQLQWVRRLGTGNKQLLMKADAQWSPNALPSMEQFTIGGRYTVRGYRENRLIADKGLVGSAELRLPVYRNSARNFDVTLAPFFDYGFVSSNNKVKTDPDHIGSAGIGLLGSAGKRLRYELYYGHAFQDFDDANDNIQDDGLSFNLSLRLL